MKMLECSDWGDKRFSEHYARVKVSGIEDTIFNHYQLCKRFKEDENIVTPQTPMEAEGRVPSYFVLDGKEISSLYSKYFYQLLWIKYLSNYPSLVKYASTFEEITDNKQGENWEDKVEIIKLFVQSGRERAMEQCEGLLRLLNGNNYVEIIGDIFLSNKDIIAHQANCKGTMDNGIAKAISQRYPNVYEDNYYFCKQCNFGRYNMGECQIVETEKNSNKYVANLYGQESEAGNTEYNYLKKALLKLKEYALTNNLSIALPYNLGAGASEEGWIEVKEIIKEVFNGYPITIYKNMECN